MVKSDCLRKVEDCIHTLGRKNEIYSQIYDDDNPHFFRRVLQHNTKLNRLVSGQKTNNSGLQLVLTASLVMQGSAPLHCEWLQAFQTQDSQHR